MPAGRIEYAGGGMSMEKLAELVWGTPAMVLLLIVGMLLTW